MAGPSRFFPRALIAPLLVGLILRAIAAFSGHGWYAMDDYNDVIVPAWKWLIADPHGIYLDPIRSAFFPRCFWVLLFGAHALGVTDPARALQLCYLGLGLYSALAIPGVYWLAEGRLGERAAVAAAWLTSAGALMPRLSTWALLEVGAVPPAVFGILFADRAASARTPAFRAALGFLAMVCLAIASMIRFQAGLLAVAAVGWFAVRAWRSREEGVALRCAPLAGLLAGGVVMGLADGLFDLLTTGRFLGALISYLEFNAKHSNIYGTNPWPIFTGQLILLTGPPATLWLAKPLWEGIKRHPLNSIAFGLFTLVHDLIPHKEERFLFTIWPLFFVPLGFALSQCLARPGRPRRAALCYSVASGLACLCFLPWNPDRNLTEPLLSIERQERARSTALHDHDRAIAVAIGLPPLPGFFLAGQVAAATAVDLDDAAGKVGGAPRAYFLRRKPFDGAELQELESNGLTCDAPQMHMGDLIDRTAVYLNPEGNGRRGPIASVACRRTE